MTQSAEDIASRLRKCFKRGNKVLVCGSGGSAQMANHFVAELIHEGLAAISLVSDLSVVTAVANDMGYENLYDQQIFSLGKKGDILVILSTTGNSMTIFNAVSRARELGMEYIDFPRRGSVPRCQEYQLRLIHDVWELLK